MVNGYTDTLRTDARIAVNSDNVLRFTEACDLLSTSLLAALRQR